MKDRLYNVRVGDVINVYGDRILSRCSFTVEKILEEIAVCSCGESQLMLPLNVALPFVVLVRKPRQAYAHPTASLHPVTERAATEEKREPAPEEPAAEEPVRGETPEQRSETKVASAPETKAETKAEAKTEAKAEPKLELLDPSEPGLVRHSRIAFFSPKGRWGKIEDSRYHNGLFFHTSMVQDDALRTWLCALQFGETCPPIEVAYEDCMNENYRDQICAGYIRAEQPLPPHGVQEGYICELGAEGGRIARGDTHLRFSFEDVADPYLLAYLRGHMPSGSIDGTDIRVRYTGRGPIARRLVWLNPEDGPDMTAEVDEEARRTWEESSSRITEEEERTISVPEFRPMRRVAVEPKAE